MMNYQFPSNQVWVDGSKLKQTLMGLNWIVELEGEIVKEAREVVDFRRNLFGFKKPYKRLEYTPGAYFHLPHGFQYVDAKGNVRLITPETKPKVRLRREGVKP